MIRKPAVAGQFYPSSGELLHREIGSYMLPNKKRKKAVAAICPHAGIHYSGHVAGKVYSSIEIGDTVIILCPNHTGQGEPFAIMTEGEWKMPNGDVSVNKKMAAKILSCSDLLKDDEKSQLSEHSIEVQLPFIQYLKKKFTIVPITLMYSDFSVCKDIAGAISVAVKDETAYTSIIASSDMTHFEPHQQAKQKDLKAVDFIINRDPNALFQYVKEKGISMCGIMPVAAVLQAANNLGANNAALIDYMTSGDISGNFDRVVGYAGIIVY